MKSEKAKKYLSKIVMPIAMMYPDAPEMCDLKLGEAKHAVELAEQEAEERVRNKAIATFCTANCPKGCSFGIGGGIGCAAKYRFIQKLNEE